MPLFRATILSAGRLTHATFAAPSSEYATSWADSTLTKIMKSYRAGAQVCAVYEVRPTWATHKQRRLEL